MTTDIFGPDCSIENTIHHESKLKKQQRHREFIYDGLVCLGLIACFATMFFAIKLCLEMSVQAVLHEIAVHVRIPQEFNAESVLP